MTRIQGDATYDSVLDRCFNVRLFRFCLNPSIVQKKIGETRLRRLAVRNAWFGAFHVFAQSRVLVLCLSFLLVVHTLKW